MRTLAALALIGGITWSGLVVHARPAGATTDAPRQLSSRCRDVSRSAAAGRRLVCAGEFETAERAFARVSTPEAEFNRGNCLVMLGKYDAAAERYTRALELRPGWEDAQINRQIALARAKLVAQTGGDMGDQQVGADEITFDKKKNTGGQDTDTEGDQPLSDAQMQALWLRRIQTKPADFLKVKFAYQLVKSGEKEESN